MPHYRFFADHALNPSDLVKFEETESHHMVKVMRLTTEDQIEIINGRGSLAIAHLSKIEKNSVTCKIDSVVIQEKPKQGFVIAQAILRPSSLELICEKNTELGVDEIWIFAAMHSEKNSLSDHQLERLEKHTISAMKQCGRLYLPKIRFFKTLKEILEQCSFPIFFGDINPFARPLLQAAGNHNKVIFFVGPEKGFDDKEIEVLEKNKGVGVSLHSLILRAETASIAASTLLSAIIKV